MEEPRKYRILRWLAYAAWVLLFLTMVIVARFIIQTNNSDIPAFSELENPQYNEASIIYDEKGRSFGKYYVENRENIDYEDLSPNILKALLATEDIRFFDHNGVDLKALFRVAFKTILLQKESAGGGSTISQQLAKLLYKRKSLSGLSKIQRGVELIRTKVKEWITAIRLEKSYTKEEIISMYLNKFEFINGAHGIQSASETYFNVDQENLTIEQAALLVGMLKNPNLYNPLRFPENATGRRNLVINQIERYYDDVDSELLDSIRSTALDMSRFERDSHDTGPAPYFRSELTKWLRGIFKKENITKADGEEYNVYTDGLKIYTTINLDYQKYAEEAVKEHMQFLQARYWEVWKNRNPWTYEADSLQRIIRSNTLERKIKESERYLSLHNQYLSADKTKAQEKYGNIPLNENVLKELSRIESKATSWSNVIYKKIISKSNRSKYESLLGDDEIWPTLKNQFQKLQKDYKEVFKKKISMEVFDYNEEGYKVIEMSPRDSVRYHNQHLQASLLAVHPITGHIKAWVGGPGFNYFKYDHVNSRRQVGSTIKPFVYATAISLMGLSPCQTYKDIQYTIAPGDDNLFVDKEWSPANANEKFTANDYNLYQGLLYSKNSITVRLIKEMGSVDVIRELLDNVGIEKDREYPNGQLVVPRVPSICLGAVDLTLYEMAGAYTTFANDGVYTQPIFVSRIEDKTGKVIYKGLPETKRAINPLYNGVMVDMLRNNVQGGFGLGVNTDIGGKTGTTNDYADGWFMSVAPELVTGVWVGGDDKWIRFLSLDDGQGFVMARPIVQKFLSGVEKDSTIAFKSDTPFPTPPPGILEFLDCDKYKQKSVEEEQDLNKLNVREDIMDDEFDEEFGDDFGDDFGDEFEDTFSDESDIENTESKTDSNIISTNKPTPDSIIQQIMPIDTSGGDGR
ncbi:transglycosylase domain-containing protein [Maribacter sp.]|uniref:transglycosylase domain-containing protein n=1 Tax=Maribacter sp. TaxID=1897614 RepID=UPI0025C15B55|nr:transglycosylase domain-containing protein [Maribacter sp.]